MQEKVQTAKKNYLRAFNQTSANCVNLDQLRTNAEFIRKKSINNLDKYLIEFESNFIKRGGKIIWAQDNLEAVSEIIGLINKSGEKLIVKSKSLTTEEIGLDEAFIQHGKEWVETDVGQYILQLANDKPSHMVMPAIHQSTEDIANLFNKKLGTDETLNREGLVATASGLIREKYKRSGVGITGANFLVANPGAVAITENEGNAWITASRHKLHIVVAGIDKVIPGFKDLGQLLPLLSMYGTGQSLTAYNSVITGPRKDAEPDGPDEMVVVLIDNGRSKVLAEESERSALHCIRCGACQYHDPIYQMIGGKAYDSTWIGPIGTVVLPHMKGFKDAGFFSELSVLSSEDSEFCPVNISFNKLLMSLRRKGIKKQPGNSTKKMFYFLWKKFMLKRDKPNWKNNRTRNYFLKNIFLRSPEEMRHFRQIAKQSTCIMEVATLTSLLSNEII